MKTRKSPPHHSTVAGFTLPSVLVVVGALLILAVGILMVAGIERDTARSFVDRQRAELAARAGLEDIHGILNAEAANDDFLVLQSIHKHPTTAGREPAPHLFIGRGAVAGGAFTHRYIPLFSSTSRPPDAPLAAPDLQALTGAAGHHIDFTTLPYLDKVRAAWLPVRDDKGRTVARYAYWVEDMQSRVNPTIAGNDKGEDKTHARVAWPFPAAGLNNLSESAAEPALNQIALYAVDPAATEADQGETGKILMENRPFLVSPESQLAAAGVKPPLVRLKSEDPATGGKTGQLVNLMARAVEQSLSAGSRPYQEQPLVPFADGIDPTVAGKPKLNLNKLLADDRSAAVDKMADFIQKALPQFEERKGAFPEDYVKTIAANALDYADEDSEATLLDGVYRGIDSYPLTTELVIKVDYRNLTVSGGHQVLNFNIRLFAELHNPTNVKISGEARLSYEVALKVSPIGSGTGTPSFDSVELLDNKQYSTHQLDQIGGRYWTKPVPVTLRPNQYKCYIFADVTYRIDQGSASGNPISSNTPFSLLEDKGESGSSLMWNDAIVERQQGVVRQQGFIYGLDKNGKKTGGYLVGTPDILSKAHLPALLYQKPSSSAFYGNTGDPRISHYLNRSKNSPLDESAYPENASPNRRALRLSIYKADAATKPKVYARMLPSEWPDGGHDPAVGIWTPGSLDATQIDEAKFDFAYDPDSKHHAIQRISNRGYFLSTTELGHVFDPIMFAPVFDDASLTNSFWSNHNMPVGVDTWPNAKTTAPNSRNPLYGGGNTLRIGRPEHPAFNGLDGKSNRAAGLLDLFHTGQPLATDAGLKTGQLIKLNGHLNINTASRDALRSLAAGLLVMDPKLSKRISTSHSPAPAMAPPTEPLKLDAPMSLVLADEIADAVMASRPYASPSGMVLATDPHGNEVFGNRRQYPDADNVRWTDAAAEEVFGRVYQAATVRSRNFRIWIVAQSISSSASSSAVPEVLAEVRKVHTIHTDPGERAPDGSIISANFKTRILSTNEF